MIQIIKPRNLVLKDKNIINAIKNLEIDRIKAEVIEENLLVFKYPDHSNTPTLGKEWVVIHEGPRTLSIRTPAILRVYTGKEIEVFKDKDNEGGFEIFRIRSIDFSFKKERASHPYFTASGCFAIPKEYAEKEKLKNMLNRRICFEYNTQKSLDEGLIFITIVDRKKEGQVSIPFNVTSTQIRTKIIKGLIEFLNSNNKKLSDFEYNCITYNESRKCYIMVFKEEI